MNITVNTKETIHNLIKSKKNKILQVDHEYQRGETWTDFQKKMFIDSIMRGYSIPAFYFHETKSEGIGGHTNKFYDIVDGQQRINALSEFADDGFVLLNPDSDNEFKFPNFVQNKECPWGGLRFSELDEASKDKFLSHKTVIFEISTEDKNEVRYLFIRLQAGTPLTPQDKRDAWPGNFTEFILKVGGKKGVDRWYGWDIFTNIAKKNDQSARRSLAAQCFMLFYSVRNDKRFCDIKSRNLDQFYHEHVDFDDASNEAKDFEKICEIISTNFSNAPKLAGYQVIDLIQYVDAIYRSDYVLGWQTKLPKALHDFNVRCKQGTDDNDKNRETEDVRYYKFYQHRTRTSSDNNSTIRRRQEFFSKKMDELVSLEPKDTLRSFTSRDKERIFFRDERECQFCKMNEDPHSVDWQEAEFHHVEPHSEGGVTHIDNGALVSKDCHPKGNHDVEKFAEWWSQKIDSKEEDARGGGATYSKNELPPDGTLCKFTYEGVEYKASIDNGKIIHEDSQYDNCKSFSGASKEITGKERNGWSDWYIKLPDKNDWVLANNWRLMKIFD